MPKADEGEIDLSLWVAGAARARVAYYMDRGQSGHLPWTSGSLYDWLRSKINGINVNSGYVSGGWCCQTIGGKIFMEMGDADEPNREFDRTWRGISGNLAFYAHEARHIDGFPHASCCGIPGGCDDAYDVNNLSPYGIQWYLNKLWLEGTINVGYGCQPQNDLQENAGWFQSDMNSQFRSRFCTNPPPLVAAPARPFGACPTVPQRRRAAAH